MPIDYAGIFTPPTVARPGDEEEWERLAREAIAKGFLTQEEDRELDRLGSISQNDTTMVSQLRALPIVEPEQPRNTTVGFESPEIDYAGIFTPKPEQDQSFLARLGRAPSAVFPGIKSGAGGIAEDFGSFGELIAGEGGLATGLREFGEATSAAAPAPESAQDFDIFANPGDTLLNPEWWAFHGGSLIPSIATFLIPGGIGGKIGVKAASALSKAGRIAKGIEQAAATGQKIGAISGASLTNGIIQSGETFRDTLEKTGDRQEASEKAAVSFALNSAFTAATSGAAQFLGKAGQTGFARARQLGTSGVVEGGQEVGEGAIQRGLQGQDLLSRESGAEFVLGLVGGTVTDVGAEVLVRRPAQKHLDVAKRMAEEVHRANLELEREALRARESQDNTEAEEALFKEFQDEIIAQQMERGVLTEAQLLRANQLASRLANNNDPLRAYARAAAQAQTELRKAAEKAGIQLQGVNALQLVNSLMTREQKEANLISVFEAPSEVDRPAARRVKASSLQVGDEFDVHKEERIDVPIVTFEKTEGSTKAKRAERTTKVNRVSAKRHRVTDVRTKTEKDPDTGVESTRVTSVVAIPEGTVEESSIPIDQAPDGVKVGDTFKIPQNDSELTVTRIGKNRKAVWYRPTEALDQPLRVTIRANQNVHRAAQSLSITPETDQDATQRAKSAVEAAAKADELQAKDDAEVALREKEARDDEFTEAGPTSRESINALTEARDKLQGFLDAGGDQSFAPEVQRLTAEIERLEQGPIQGETSQDRLSRVSQDLERQVGSASEAEVAQEQRQDQRLADVQSALESAPSESVGQGRETTTLGALNEGDEFFREDRGSTRFKVVRTTEGGSTVVSFTDPETGLDKQTMFRKLDQPVDVLPKGIERRADLEPPSQDIAGPSQSLPSTQQNEFLTKGGGRTSKTKVSTPTVDKTNYVREVKIKPVEATTPIHLEAVEAGKRFGSKVQFIEPTGNGIPGMHSEGVIYLDATLDRDQTLAAFAHEWVHDFRERNSGDGDKTWNEFAGFLEKEAPALLEAAKGTYLEAAGKKGMTDLVKKMNSDKDLAAEEGLATLAQIFNEDILTRLRMRQGLFSKIRDAINGVWIKGGSKQLEEFKTIKAFADLMGATSDTVDRKPGTTPQPTSNPGDILIDPKFAFDASDLHRDEYGNEVRTVPEMADHHRLKGSKVRVGGNPVFLMHGTASAYVETDEGKFNERGLFGPGYYNTTSHTVAGGTEESAKRDVFGYASKGMGETFDISFETEEEAVAFFHEAQNDIDDAIDGIRSSTGLGATLLNWVSPPRKVARKNSDGDVIPIPGTRGPQVEEHWVVKIHHKQPNVRPAYANIKKPFDLEKKIEEGILEKIVDNNVLYSEPDKDILPSQTQFHRDKQVLFDNNAMDVRKEEIKKFSKENVESADTSKMGFTITSGKNQTNHQDLGGFVFHVVLDEHLSDLIPNRYLVDSVAADIFPNDGGKTWTIGYGDTAIEAVDRANGNVRIARADGKPNRDGSPEIRDSILWALDERNERFISDRDFGGDDFEYRKDVRESNDQRNTMDVFFPRNWDEFRIPTTKESQSFFRQETSEQRRLTNEWIGEWNNRIEKFGDGSEGWSVDLIREALDSTRFDADTNHTLWKFLNRNVRKGDGDGHDLVAILKKLGFDGIKHVGGRYRNSSNEEHTVWIAWDNEQMVPAYATEAKYSTGNIPSSKSLKAQADAEARVNIRASGGTLGLDVGEPKGTTKPNTLVDPKFSFLDPKPEMFDDPAVKELENITGAAQYLKEQGIEADLTDKPAAQQLLAKLNMRVNKLAAQANNLLGIDLMQNVILQGEEIDPVLDVRKGSHTMRGVDGLGETVARSWADLVGFAGGKLGTKLTEKEMKLFEHYMKMRTIQAREPRLKKLHPDEDTSAYSFHTVDEKTNVKTVWDAAKATEALAGLERETSTAQWNRFKIAEHALEKHYNWQLDYLVDTGVISAEDAKRAKGSTGQFKKGRGKLSERQLSDAPYLGPIDVIEHAFNSDGELNESFKGTPGLSVHDQSVFQKLKGGTKIPDNMLVSSVEKIFNVVKIGKRNEVMNKIFNLRHLEGEAGKRARQIILVPEVDSKGNTKPIPAGWAQVEALTKGRNNTFYVPVPIEQTIRGLNKSKADFIIRHFGQWNRLLRFGATTANITFAFTNPLRDYWTQAVRGEHPLTPKDLGLIFESWWIASGLFQTKAGKRIYRDFLKGGSAFSSRLGTLKAEATAKELLHAGNLGVPWMPGFGPAVGNIIQMAQASEEMMRLAAFRKTRAIKAGFKSAKSAEVSFRHGKHTDGSIYNLGPLLEGGYAGGENSIDFRGAGKLLQMLNTFAPFISARGKGFATLVEGVKENPGRAFWLASAGMTAAIGLAIRNRIEESELMDDIAAFVREANFIWIHGSYIDNADGVKKPIFTKLPKGDFFRGITSVAEDLVDNVFHLRGKSKDHWNAWQMLVKMASQISPYDFADGDELSAITLISQFMPVPVKLVVEHNANYDFFRHEERITGRLKSLKPEQQFLPWTSRSLVALGQHFGWSPIQLEKNLAGATGGLSKDLTRVIDYLFFDPDPREAERPLDKRVSDWPVIKAFYSTRGGEKQNVLHKAISKAEVEADTQSHIAQKQVDVALANWDTWGVAERQVFIDKMAVSEDIANRFKSSLDLMRKGRAGKDVSAHRRMMGFTRGDKRATAIKHVFNEAMFSKDERLKFLQSLNQMKIIDQREIVRVLLWIDDGTITPSKGGQ